MSSLSFIGLNSATLTNNPFRVSWIGLGDGNDSSDGVLLSVNFRILETATDGVTPITIILDSAFNQDEESVMIAVPNAYVTIESHIYGDANGDGIVNLLDAMRIAQWYNGWGVDICEICADANGDYRVDLLDAMRIVQWYNGWGVTLGPQ